MMNSSDNNNVAPKDDDTKGVKINLISRETISAMSSDEKIDFIIKQVLSVTVLVLEQGLTPIEEAELYKRTMSVIDQDTFIGIEIQGIAPSEIRKRNIIERLLGLRRREPPRMSVIGPAHLLKTIYKDGRQIRAVIVTKAPEGEGIETSTDIAADKTTHGSDEIQELFSDMDELKEWHGDTGSNNGIKKETSSGSEVLRPVRADIEGHDVYRVIKRADTGEDTGGDSGSEQNGGNGARD